MKRRHTLLIAGLVYATTLIVTAPADLAYRWLAARMPAIAQALPLDGVDGTLWHGHAEQALLGRGIVLQDLEWRIRPFDLMSGRVGIAVDGHWRELKLSTVVQMALDGVTQAERRLTLRDVRVSAPLEQPPLAGRLPFRGTGRLRIDLDEAIVAPSRRPLPITRITGRITLEGLALEQAGGQPLGGIGLRLETNEAGRISGRFKDDGQGPLAIEGEIRIHKDGNRYTLEAILGLRDPRRSDLAQALRLFGTPGPDGRLRIEHQGRLSQDLPMILAFSSPS